MQISKRSYENIIEKWKWLIRDYFMSAGYTRGNFNADVIWSLEATGIGYLSTQNYIDMQIKN